MGRLNGLFREGSVRVGCNSDERMIDRCGRHGGNQTLNPGRIGDIDRLSPGLSARLPLRAFQKFVALRGKNERTAVRHHLPGLGPPDAVTAANDQAGCSAQVLLV